MNRTEFHERLKFFRIGECVKLTCRGNYGDYVEVGRLVKVEFDRVYLDRGFSHHFSRIIRIDVCLEKDEEKLKR